MRFILFSILFGLTGAGLNAQSVTKVRQDTLLRTVVINGDTLPHIDLKEVPILPAKVFKNRFQERQYWRLVYNLKKVLPYSKIVAATITEVEFKLATVKTDKERRKFVKSMEDSLRKKYEEDLRQMTITQGKLLLKLVDRETSNSTYFWIDSYRGSVSAFFWQGIARLFGSNLKSQYDPKGEDAIIEQIVTYIERGYI
ncbi:MAG: DUF4294 domain-containing protein [Porphyromonadaceae bacterium]|nr:MAG: DUF4294 domain-containing protein [Porphyromonadaceae bacterium]